MSTAYVHLAPADVLHARDLLRATWSRNLAQDVLIGVTFGIGADAELAGYARHTFEHMTESGIGYAASQPTVAGEADSFTIDIRVTGLGDGKTAAEAARRLNTLTGWNGPPLQRLERLSGTATSEQNVSGREAASQEAGASSGAAGVVSGLLTAGRTLELLAVVGAGVFLWLWWQESTAPVRAARAVKRRIGK